MGHWSATGPVSVLSLVLCTLMLYTVSHRVTLTSKMGLPLNGRNYCGTEGAEPVPVLQTIGLFFHRKVMILQRQINLRPKYDT